MYIYLFGEGKTDLGQCINRSDCISVSSVPKQMNEGPIKIIIEKLLNEHEATYHLLYRAFLEEYTLPPKRRRFFIPKDKETSDTSKLNGHGKNAFDLGIIARVKEFDLADEDTEDNVLAILFCDDDGTHSHPGDWSQKFKDIENGFKVSGFKNGLPLIANPKSEVWLIMATRGYKDISSDFSGNNNCKNENKKCKNVLKKILKKNYRIEDDSESQVNWVREHLDPHALVGCPSFKKFYERLEEVLGRKLAPVTEEGAQDNS
jgi:hypothetical protein